MGEVKMRSILSIRKSILAAAAFGFVVFSTILGSAPAVASVTHGTEAFRNGDFTTAVGEFQGPAYNGDPVAQYYMGVLYTDGLGVRRSIGDGLMWFICAQTGSLPPALNTNAKRRRAEIVEAMSTSDFDRSEIRAHDLCGAAPSKGNRLARGGYNVIEEVRPHRGVVGSLLFFPGDTTVTGALVVFHESGLHGVRKLLTWLTQSFGDWLFGLVALLGWLVIARMGYFFGAPIIKRMIGRNASIRATVEDVIDPEENSELASE